MARPRKTKAWPSSPGESMAAMPCSPARTMRTSTSCFPTTSTSGMSTRCSLNPSFRGSWSSLGTVDPPIETEAGWLVLSHGVGPMRKYCIGAFLLDRDDPSKVIGRLREPLIKPNENEREGYVPNVVYSCGSLLHGRQLIIPYAMSDYATTFPTLPLDDILA